MELPKVKLDREVEDKILKEAVEDAGYEVTDINKNRAEYSAYFCDINKSLKHFKEGLWMQACWAVSELLPTCIYPQFRHIQDTSSSFEYLIIFHILDEFTIALSWFTSALATIRSNLHFKAPC